MRSKQYQEATEELNGALQANGETATPFPQRWGLPRKGRAVFRREDRVSWLSCPGEAREQRPARR
jgi:hypothetical protein